MRRRDLLLACASLALIALTALIALSVGSADIPHVWSYIFGQSTDAGYSEILWQIRLPRIAMALIIGAALGVAGAISQAATNNPLADPAIIGTTAGASLGATVAVISGVSAIGQSSLILYASIGALLISYAIYLLARSAFEFLIVGIAASALITAIVGILLTVADRPEARSLSFWSTGSLALTTREGVVSVGALVLLAVGVSVAFAHHLDFFALGDRAMSHLGINPRLSRGAALSLIALLIGASVSAVGSIAFLALAAPHIVRMVVGPRNRIVIVGSALLGSALLLAADTVARTVAPPHELPIGLITALIGAPLLILILRRSAQIWR